VALLGLCAGETTPIVAKYRHPWRDNVTTRSCLGYSRSSIGMSEIGPKIDSLVFAVLLLELIRVLGWSPLASRRHYELYLMDALVTVVLRLIYQYTERTQV
jgi:hypothetical protein